MLNKIEIIGNLGSEPELRFAPSGKPVASFSVATNRKYTTTDGEKKEDTEWFTVVTWNRQAEMCNQFLAKGRKVFVMGRLHSHSWDGEDGQKHFRNEIIANSVIFLDKAKEADGSGLQPDEPEPENIPF